MMFKAFRPLVAVLLVSALALAGCGKKPEPADFVLTNGKIVTMDEARPEAQALAARGGLVVAVGTVKEIQAYVGPATQVVDLGGRLATPGLIDSHLHFTGIGQAKLSLDLTKVRSWDEIVAMVGEAARKAKPGEPITGRGWHQEKWDRRPEPNVDGLPLHDALSKVSPDNPVVLTHASGHSCLANAKAMELGKVTSATPNPAGGQVIKDAKGRPIGAFLETAQGLVRRGLSQWAASRTPEDRLEEQRKVIELADQECLAKGLTSVTDAGVGWSQVELYKSAIDQGKLGVRLNVMLSESNRRLAEKAAEWKMIGYGDNHLTVRTIKRLIDGALGAHGAWLLEPYADLPASTGLNTEPIEALTETARIAIENGFQLSVHAIGDRANRETLDIYEAAFKAHPDKKDVRFRVEHAQHLAPSDIARFGALGVVAAMQAIHCTSDGPWIALRLGEKRAEEGAYVWRRLMDSGAVVSNGTDAPVEDCDPIPGFYASVTRRMKNGQEFYPGQKMTRQEALRSYTLNGAYAAFEEGIKGSLAAGQAGRRHGLLQGHHDLPGGGDPDGGSPLDHRRRQGPLQEVTPMEGLFTAQSPGRPADADRPGDRPGHRQHRLHLHPGRPAARGPAQAGPGDRPGPGHDQPHRPAAVADLDHAPDQAALRGFRPLRSPVGTSSCSWAGCSCWPRARTRSTSAWRARPPRSEVKAAAARFLAVVAPDHGPGHRLFAGLGHHGGRSGPPASRSCGKVLYKK